MRQCFCGLWQSKLEPLITSPQAWEKLDETLRGDALRSLRRANFAQVLARIGAIRKDAKGRLLDVGCAHGWFFQQAQADGYEAIGIEPDPRIAARAQLSGCDVKVGFFPDVLAPEDCFDVIIFNDVFEHLPNPQMCLSACFEHLRIGGLLVINLPSSRGVFFKIARLLNKVGRAGPWLRMWQAGFPSPHLFYFNDENLKQMVQQHGFERCHESNLSSLKVAGLWARLRMDTRTPIVIHAFQWLTIAALSPLLHVLPSDISLACFVNRSSELATPALLNAGVHGGNILMRSIFLWIRKTLSALNLVKIHRQIKRLQSKYAARDHAFVGKFAID